MVSIGSAKMCPREAAGCTSWHRLDNDSSTGISTIRSARIILINREVRALGRRDQDSVVAHELGHALGLNDFNGVYKGSVQVMNAGAYAAGGIYRAGDRNGLIALRPISR